MRMYRAQAGPFLERPFFEDEELESIAEDELRKASLMPGAPSPLRIDCFIEKRFKLIPEYDDLPIGILGFTQFGDKGAEAVVLTRALAEDGSRSSERLTSSTLAHEAGHMLLHSHLFYLERRNATMRLLDEDLDDKEHRILCRNESNPSDGATRSLYDGRWWEYQANQMIGPLLMPRDLALVVVEPLTQVTGQLGLKGLERSRRDRATQLVADVFEVNPAAARVRINKLFPEVSAGQLAL